MKFDVHLKSVSGNRARTVELEASGPGYRVLLDGRPVEANVALVAPGIVSVLLGSRSYEVHLTPAPDGSCKMQCGPHEFTAEVHDPRAWRGRRQGAVEAEGRQQIAAPMPGKVIRILVNVGEEVEAGQGLVVVEAMKMQNEIRSPKKGRVERLQAKEGQNVNAGEVLCVVF